MDLLKEWEWLVREYRKHKLPWETSGSHEMYEAWCFHVALLSVGARFDVREWINERNGLEHDDPTNEDGESLFGSPVQSEAEEGASV